MQVHGLRVRRETERGGEFEDGVKRLTDGQPFIVLSCCNYSDKDTIYAIPQTVTVQECLRFVHLRL